ncbi:hypothetical protein [Paenibacillus fonticola]|uniref:hypothetical protein n=1 Tax=Paenibacillus fonticola TaxID=379896 RepID=UPI0012FC12E4|nr:hypothetical protein [Paenibacillus fonticola]
MIQINTVNTFKFTKSVEPAIPIHQQPRKRPHDYEPGQRHSPSISAVWPPTGQRHSPSISASWPPTGRRHGPATPPSGRLPAEDTAQQLRRLAAYRPKTRPSNSAVWPPTGKRHSPSNSAVWPPTGQRHSPSISAVWPPTGRRHGPATPPLATYRPKARPSNSAAGHLSAKAQSQQLGTPAGRGTSPQQDGKCQSRGNRLPEILLHKNGDEAIWHSSLDEAEPHTHPKVTGALFKHAIFNVFHVVLLVGFPVLWFNDLSFLSWNFSAHTAHKAAELRFLLVSLLFCLEKFLRVIGQSVWGAVSQGDPSFQVNVI